MKRIRALCLAALMLTALTACSDQESSSVADIGETEATEAPTEPPAPTPTVDANAITFETGEDFFTAHVMNQENFENDESDCTLSLAKYNGTRQLRVQVLDQKEEGGYKVPKIVFDVAKLVGAENLSRIKRISCDVTAVAVGTFTAKNGEEILVPGNLMLGIAGKLAPEKTTEQADWTTFTEKSTDEWEHEWAYLHVDADIVLSKNRYQNGYEDASVVFMRWSIPNQADLYLDNLTFYDDDGNSIPIVYLPAS